MWQFKPGDHVGKFILGEKIGEGGMGHVFKGLEFAVDRMVAIKFLDEMKSKDPEHADRFRNEARALGRLMHPNIVGLFAFGEERGCAYIAMEYVEGVNLKGLIDNYAFGLKESVNLFRQMLSGLGEAHHQGILHRDLKPENILLTRDFRVKISDFGLAKVTGEAG